MGSADSISLSAFKWHSPGAIRILNTLNFTIHLLLRLLLNLGADSKKIKGKDSKSSKKGTDPPLESPKPDPVETINPLLDVCVEKEQDKLFIPGNTTLVFLTLACKFKVYSVHNYVFHLTSISVNRIGDDGVHAFLEAIKMQEMYSQLGSGLLQLSLQNNVASDKTTDMIEINELLFARKSRFQGE